MELDYSEPRRLRRRPQPWLHLTLLIGFFFCLLLGIGALVTFVLLQTESPSETAAPPSAAFPREQIVPQHALAELAGDPSLPLAYQALSAGELDTAYAIALFAGDLSDTQRLALLLQLGRRYLETERPEVAVQALNLARSTAILGHTLSTRERSQALVQVANGLFAAGADVESLDAAHQAKRLAVQAPDLLPAQRSQIFESLRPLAQQLDDEAFAQEIAELIRNPYLTPAGGLLSTGWLTLTEAVPADPAVDAAVAARVQAARLLADRIALTGGIDIDPERQTLAAALIAEDQARAAAFQSRLATGLTSNQQLYLFQDRHRWLLLKARIALGGFGMAVVPEWDANAAAILQELTTAANNVFGIVDAMATAQPAPVDQANLRTAGLLWLAQQSERGFLPGVATTDLSERLRVAQSELARLGAPLALPVTHVGSAQPPGFRIVPANAIQP